MVLNLIVIEGKVLFYLANNQFNEFKEIIICKNDLKRITIMPNQWVSFTSLTNPSSKIMNIANLTNKEDITEKIIKLVFGREAGLLRSISRIKKIFITYL